MKCNGHCKVALVHRRKTRGKEKILSWIPNMFLVDTIHLGTAQTLVQYLYKIDVLKLVIHQITWFLPLDSRL